MLLAEVHIVDCSYREDTETQIECPKWEGHYLRKQPREEDEVDTPQCGQDERKSYFVFAEVPEREDADDEERHLK